VKGVVLVAAAFDMVRWDANDTIDCVDRVGAMAAIRMISSSSIDRRRV